MAFNAATTGKSLPSTFRHNATSNFTWAEAKRLGKADRICGEIRSAKDLAGVPRGTPLRVVSMPDGSLRWADSNKMTRIFREAAHDYLACIGDDALPTREGYLTVSSSGEVVVSSKKTY